MNEMGILFCRPGRGSTLEDAFEIEADVVDALEVQTHVVNADLVADGEADLALEAAQLDGGALLYRGPILPAETYEALEDALRFRGVELAVDSVAYEHALYVPEHHDAIEDLSAPTRWTYGTDIGEAWAAALELGDPPWLIKDHVKSAKEQWESACFVPEGATQADFQDVAEGLLEHRGELFERGFVIRKFLDLATSSVRTLERRIPEEHRLFFWQGALVAHAPYHPIVDPLRDTAAFEVLGSRIDSPFFTADVAFLSAGGWVVIEINDGGVSTLPEDLHPRDLYAQIFA